MATCGTALTEKHLELVTKAGARELVFIFDGDQAGIRAAQRASEIAAAAGAPARVLVPPDGEDPDETVLRGELAPQPCRGNGAGCRVHLGEGHEVRSFRSVKAGEPHSAADEAR